MDAICRTGPLMQVDNVWSQWYKFIDMYTFVSSLLIEEIKIGDEMAGTKFI